MANLVFISGMNEQLVIQPRVLHLTRILQQTKFGYVQNGGNAIGRHNPCFLC